jgi:glycosyltransferase involved in cell wall biosynthesis
MSEFEILKHTPSVSVIIATYNRADFISRAIESVLNQSYKDFELIIIDDGSTDNTKEIVAKYKDFRIKYIWKEHGGRSRARNMGIELSRGKYIAFLDSDDFYLPNKLFAESTTLNNNLDIGMTLSGWRIVNQQGRVIVNVRPWEYLALPLSLEDWLFSGTTTSVSFMVRKEWLQRINGFNPRLCFSEDVELWIRLALARCPMLWTKDIVGVYFIHKAMSLHEWHKVREGRIKFLETCFSNSEFILNLKLSKQDILSIYHINLAWDAYALGIIADGKQELEIALSIQPKLLDLTNKIIVKSLIEYSQYFIIEDPVVFAECVFHQLPLILKDFKKYRREILGTIWKIRVYHAFQERNFYLVRYGMFRVLWYAPGAALRDRGFISMGLQSLVGQHIWSIFRLFLSSILAKNEKR